MADTLLVGRNFDLGFQSDTSRDQLPRGAAYRMRDWIPQLEAPLRKRGGWSQASADLNAASAATSLSGLAWAPFAGDPHLISLSEIGKLYRSTTFANGTFIGATHGQGLTHRPFWHRDRMIVPAALGGAAANPYKYYDSGGGVYATAVIGGTPPQARGGFSWGDYLVLFNYYEGGVLKNYRMAFSSVGNPDAWVYSGASSSHFDIPEEMVAGLQLRNVIIAWGYANTYMITGDTPPPGGNLARRTLFNGNGCFDGRSVATYREYAIWANNAGVYRTDGATLTDLTKAGGISLFWRELVRGFSQQQGWKAAGGVYAGNYVLTVTTPAGVATTLICDLDRQVWTTFTNIEAVMFAERSAGPGTALMDGSEELFFAHPNAPRAARMSTCWDPDATVALDGDGAAVLPEIEFAFDKVGETAMKRVRRAFVNYDIRTAGASPSLAVSAVFSPEDAAYTALGSLPTTTELTRDFVDVREQTYGIGLKIAQVGASADTRLYEIELEGHLLEGTR